MAKTLKQMTDSVIEQASNFQVTDDNEYPFKLVEDILVSTHPTLIREYFNNRHLDTNVAQIESNVPTAPLSNDIVVEGVTIKSTSEYCTASIPQLVNGISGMEVIYVGTADLTKSFSKKSFDAFLKRGKQKYTLPNPAYTIFGNTILIDGDVKYVSIIGYFRDPREVNTYNEEKAFPTVSEYKMELLALQQLLTSKNIPFDIINDGQRDVVVPRTKRRVNANPNPNG